MTCLIQKIGADLCLLFDVYYIAFLEKREQNIRMKKLYLFGSPELRDKDDRIDQSFLTGPKRLGLLAYMVLERSGQFVRRDTLLPLFWPTSSQKNARNALSNILYHMRQSLGDSMVLNRGDEEIKLGELWCDVHQFQKAVQNKNHNLALDLYKGPLLEGFHIPDISSKFQQWLDLERQQLSQKYCNILKKSAQEAEQQGNVHKAYEFWQKCKKVAPLELKVTRKLIVTLVALGRRSEAMRIGREFANKLEEQLGADADEKFNKLIQGLDESVSEIIRIKKYGKRNTDSFEIVLSRYGLNKKTEVYIEGAFDDFKSAFMHYANKKLSKSSEYYQKALEKAYAARQKNPKKSILHFTEGLAFYHLKRNSEAIFAFEEALTLTKPGDFLKTKIWSALAVTNVANGDISESKKWLNKIKTTSDKYALALVYASLGNYSKTVEILDHLEQQDSLTNFSLRYLFPEILDPIRNSKSFSLLKKSN